MSTTPLSILLIKFIYGPNIALSVLKSSHNALLCGIHHTNIFIKILCIRIYTLGGIGRTKNRSNVFINHLTKHTYYAVFRPRSYQALFSFRSIYSQMCFKNICLDRPIILFLWKKGRRKDLSHLPPTLISGTGKMDFSRFGISFHDGQISFPATHIFVHD